MQKILLIVDVQQGFLLDENTKVCAERIQKLVANKKFDTVICTQFKNEQGSIYEKAIGWMKMESATEQELTCNYSNRIISYAKQTKFALHSWEFVCLPVLFRSGMRVLFLL